MLYWIQVDLSDSHKCSWQSFWSRISKWTESWKGIYSNWKSSWLNQDKCWKKWFQSLKITKKQSWDFFTLSDLHYNLFKLAAVWARKTRHPGTLCCIWHLLLSINSSLYQMLILALLYVCVYCLWYLLLEPKELLNLTFSLPLFSLCNNMLHIRQAVLLKGRQHELDGKRSFLNSTFNLFTKYFYSTYYVSGITPTTSQMLIHLMPSWQACGGGIISGPMLQTRKLRHRADG